MKSKAAFVLVFGLFASSGVFAADRYQTIKDFFDASADDIAVSDFESNKLEETTQKCVFVDQASPNELQETDLFLVKLNKAGEPDAGPLFPGTPDQQKTVVTWDFQSTGRGSDEYRYDQLFDKLETEFFQKEVVTIFPDTDESTGLDYGAHFTVRKSGAHLSFKIQRRVYGDYYGYCWK